MYVHYTCIYTYGTNYTSSYDIPTLQIIDKYFVKNQSFVNNNFSTSCKL